MQMLTAKQIDYFQTFGFLKLEGALADDIDWIIEEFEGIFETKQVQHDGTQRSCLVPFVDQSERLCTLLEHPVVLGTASSLLGSDFNYIGSDGNYYSGDTGWHSDGFHSVGSYLKIAFYLDKVTRETGALRVIPASHLTATRPHWQDHNPGGSTALWGVEQRDVPAVALETNPGDLLMFNHNLWHAAFGGSSKRRMFTLNLCRRCQNEDEIQDLEDYIGVCARFWQDHIHGDIMRGSAPPERWLHLEQVIAHEGHLPGLVVEAKKRMKEPSRG